MLGNAGAGKTHLATALGRRLGLDVVHLDRLFWRPGWAQSSRDEFVDATRRALSSDGRWVADGNYADTFDVRVPMADLIVVLDMATALCLWPVLARSITTTTRPDMAPGCEERILRRDYAGFLRYVATYRSKRLPRLLARIAAIDHAARVVTLRRRAEVATLIASIG